MAGHVIAAESRLPAEGALEQIGIALCEVFDNAERWGRRGPDQRQLAPSFRMLRVEWRLPTRPGLRSLGKGDNVISAYLVHESTAPALGGYLELSVVDAGPGISARGLSQEKSHGDVTLSMELDATLRCFVDGYTDDPSGEGEGRGHGFTNVFEVLTDLGGAIRVRTGRLSLSRDFVANPFGNAEYTRPRLWDSATGGVAPSEQPQIVGTAVTLIVPVGDGH
jgi:hypothetical protein